MKRAESNLWGRLIPSLMAAITLALGMCGCSQVDAYGPDVAQRTWLEFMQDGKTTRQEMIAKLGQPTASYEGGRIMGYRMIAFVPRDFSGVFKESLYEQKPQSAQEWSSYLRQSATFEVVRAKDAEEEARQAWRTAEWTLIAVFDERQVLSRHAIVAVKNTGELPGQQWHW